MQTTYDDFDVKKSRIAGLGVFARVDIPKGTYLYLKPKGSTIGVIRQKDQIPEGVISYCVAQHDGSYLCPANFNNIEPVWYLNHSLEPNAIKRDDGYYALHRIRAGEEITIDYNSLDEPEDAKESFYRAKALKRGQVEEKYRNMGLEVEYGKDKPSKVYKPHRHEKTYLYTLSGSISIKLGSGDWISLNPGNEIIVNSGQIHEAKVGSDGWEYLAAWDSNEAKLYENSK